MTEFSAAFRERYLGIGHESKRSRPADPAIDLWSWRTFVDRCVDGYDDNLAEYRADLWVRRQLQTAVDDAALRRTAGYAEFVELLRVIDADFRAVATVELRLSDQVVGWWNRVVPHSGGSEFVQDVRVVFGVEITDIEDDSAS